MHARDHDESGFSSTWLADESAVQLLVCRQPQACSIDIAELEFFLFCFFFVFFYHSPPLLGCDQDWLWDVLEYL